MASGTPRKISIFWRIFAFLARYCLAAQNMGLWGAFRVYVLSRWNARLQSVDIRGLGKFWFRGRTDFGVMSHYYILNYHLLDSAANPVRTIVDGGANIGDETRRFAHFHPDATIVAVEPETENFAMLSRNAEQFPKIVPRRAGLWSRQGMLSIAPADIAEGFSVSESTGVGHGSCEALTIPGLMAQMGWDTIDILKLDIEGAEYELFGEGVEEWVGKVNCFIFEVPDCGRTHSTARIFRSLPSEEYHTEVCGENLIVMKSSLGWVLSREELL